MILIFFQYGPAFQGKIIVREGRVLRPLAGHKAAYLALVFLHQADQVVFGMALKEHQAEAVLADREMRIAVLAHGQDAKPGLLKLGGIDLVIARMRHIEAGVHAADQRVFARHDPVREDPPALARWPRAPLLPIAKLQHGMRREAGTQGRGHVFKGPGQHLAQGRPERLGGELLADHIGPGDDQGVQPLGADLPEAPVIAFDMGAARARAPQLGEGEGV